MQKLEAPPIIEVMCGFLFDPIPHLDPVAVGGWWHQIKAAYPNHKVQPAVTDSPGIFFSPGAGALRAWLVSADDEWVIQIQAERFYVNWRRRSGDYPRFSDHEGGEGVLSRAMREFERFREYCRIELSHEILPVSAELAKVDLLIEGKHWKDQADLGTLVPLVADVQRFTKAGAAEFALQLNEPRPRGVMQLSLSLTFETLYNGQVARALKLETRASQGVDRDASKVRYAFESLNDDVNDVFYGLLQPDALNRFRVKI